MIKCPIEKAAGRQYTKRILPSFLAPFCVIRQDLALKAFVKFENNKSLTTSAREEIALMLGCLDLRTVQKHMQAITSKLHFTQSEICRFLTTTGSSIPYLQPGTSSSEVTLSLIRQLKECFSTMRGKIIPASFFAILPLINHLDHYNFFSMTYASRRKAFWDTS